MIGGTVMCCPLRGHSVLTLDSTTIYGVFFVMWYLSIASFLCDTKQPLFIKIFKLEVCLLDIYMKIYLLHIYIVCLHYIHI